jgi:hypothetical protein
LESTFVLLGALTMSRGDILAAQKWPSNAELIEAVAEIHLHRDMKAMDVTYGKGVWWNCWKPRRLVKHDIALNGVDFRHLPHRSGTFELVAYDPPYVSEGGRETSTIPEFLGQYGLLDAPRSPAALQYELINPGLEEVYRTLQWGGFALVKCMDYISSGKLWPGVYETTTAAYALGFEVVDKFYFVGDVRQQPRYYKCRTCDGKGRWPQRDGTQPTCIVCSGCGELKRATRHARQNLSVLLVLQAPKSPAAERRNKLKHRQRLDGPEN